MRKASLVLAAVLALIVVGCGGDDNDDSSGAAGTGADTAESAGGGGGGDGGGGAATKLTLVADPDGAPKFDKTELSAKPGKVTITMDNPSSAPHAVEVEGNGVEQETETLTEGKASMTVDLKEGTYEFYCPVDGHRQAGMEGTLTVG
jgi:plastocyanin